MKLTDVFIRRPVLALVVNLIVLIGGLQAIRTLDVRQYPRIESATIAVKTVYVGASAELVRGFVTTPLERSIAAAAGIDYIESQSVQGLSTINVRLKLNFDAAAALADVSARVAQVRADLPPESEIPSITIEPSDSAFASMYLSFGSDILAENQVTDYLIRVAQPRLSAIDGVQRAEILGGRTFALRAWLKPDRMAALGISPSEVRAALAANNYLAAVGETKGALLRVDLAASTDVRDVEGFRKLVVRRTGDTLVRLSDVAEVVLGAESYDSEVRFSGKRAVFMGVWVQPTANTVDVIARVRKEIEAIQRELPSGMHAYVAFDATRYIDTAIEEVVKTLLETILIVIVVIFSFLGALRTVIVPVVAIPLSLVGAMFLMQVFGFTLNLLTLLAIVLSVGLVVDDAIVVVENVERHMRDGSSPLRAAKEGARELVGPIVAMTITLAAVYVPIGFQAGLTGALFREFAFTLAGAVLISGFVALTLSPMMCSRLLQPHDRQGALARRIERGFDRIRERYGRLVAGTLAARGWVYLVWGLLSLLVVPMYVFSPKELAPVEDQGVIFGTVDAPPNASIEQLMPYTERVGRVYASVPEFDHCFQLTLTTGGFGGLLVKPWEERTRSIQQIQPEVAAQLAQISGVRAPAFLPPALPSPGTFPVEIVLASTAGHDEIVRYADQLVREAQASGQFAFPPIVDVKIDQARTEIVLDRDRVAALGLTMQQVGGDLAALLGGNFVNRFDIEGRSYKVIAQVERAARLSPAQLGDLRVGAPGGRLVPLSAIATLKEGVEPRTLNRFQQLNSVKISGVATRSLDDALQAIEATAARILPSGYRVEHTGESRQLREERGRFLPALALALVLIFLVLAAQFDSFRDPFVVLAGSVPLAMFGALAFTFLKFTGPPGLRFAATEGWTTTLNIYSQVGLVTLVGLVSKNAILIVQFANQQQLAGASKIDAVHAAAMTRLRPILMTTVATVAGHFPLTLVRGAGAAARNSIGLVLVGGMSIGSLLTLFVVPSLYVLLARDHAKSRARDEDSTAGELPAPTTAE
jgi:multidrug efflux pump